jgi:hypothetical protein
MRAARRIASILLLVWACICLVCVLGFAFIDDNTMKPWIMALFAVLALVPLGLGVAVTPGERWQEAGAVLITAAVTTALLAVTFVLLAQDSKFMALMPPGSEKWLEDMDDLATGFGLIALTGGLGWWLARGRRGSA